MFANHIKIKELHLSTEMSSNEANAGAVAFVRRGPDLDAFGGVVLKSFGEVPEDFDVD
jgi:hypothetical protein